MVTLAKKIGDITIEEIGQYGALSLFWIVVIILVLAFILVRKRKAENDAQPVLEENAKVIEKPETPPNSIVIIASVVFETETGKRLRLHCKPNDVYVVGDEGRLRWQGTRLYSFERGKTISPETKTDASTADGATGTPQGHIPAWQRVQMEEENARRNAENSDS